jgi:hypothetical protein
VVIGKWNKNFFDRLDKRKEIDLLGLPSVDDAGNFVTKNISEYDHIICRTFPQKKTLCKGTNFGFEGIPELKLGEDFQSIHINGSVDQYIYEDGYTVSIYTPNHYKFSCVNYEMKKGGKKLSCL